MTRTGNGISGHRHRAEPRGPGVAPQPDQEQDARRHRRREAVPVADRIAEPAGGRRQERAEILVAAERGLEAAGKRQAGDDHEAEREAARATPGRSLEGRRSPPARTAPGSRGPGRPRRRRRRCRSPSRSRSPSRPPAPQGTRRRPRPRPGTRERGHAPMASAITTAHQTPTVAPAVSSLEYPPLATASATYRTGDAGHDHRVQAWWPGGAAYS